MAAYKIYEPNFIAEVRWQDEMNHRYVETVRGYDPMDAERVGHMWASQFNKITYTVEYRGRRGNPE